MAGLKRVFHWTGACLTLASLAACSSSPQPRKYTDSERADVYFEAAVAAFRDHDVASALKHLESAEALREAWPELLHLRGLAYYSQRENALAETTLRKALQMKPGYSDARFSLGRLLYDSGRTAEAIPELTRAGDDLMYSDSFKPNTTLGVHYYRQGDYAEAEKRFLKATDAAPLKSCQAHYYLGHLLVKKKDLKAAQAEYERASRKYCGAFAEAHLALATMHERRGEFDLARRKLLDITKQFAKTPTGEQAVARLKTLP